MQSTSLPPLDEFVIGMRCFLKTLFFFSVVSPRYEQPRAIPFHKEERLDWMMKFSLLSTLLCIYTCLAVACLAQDCNAAKSWADIVAAPSSKSKTPPSNNNNVGDDTNTKQKQSTPGVYRKLPRNVERHLVRNVYDGDTLTLVDERRVRFLGIDTPELKEQQAYAQEAKAYTKQYCHKKEIYLDIRGKDKFGRLRAIVWVPLDDNNNALFLNVNEGLVANGFATVYLTTKNERLPNIKTLLALQNTARMTKRGLWQNFVERNVVVTQYGSAYHLPTCRHLAKSRNTRIITSSTAIDQGLHACRTCLADEI